MHAELTKLSSRHPLNASWGEPTLFVETARVAGVAIHLAGLLVSDARGRKATGSAACLKEAPLARAYYELFERTSLLDAIEWTAPECTVLNADGRSIGVARRDEVFPASADDGQFRYSVSSGVAAAASWPEACRRGALELIERDRILRSWYGELPARRIAFGASAPPEPLGEIYEFGAYAFDHQDPARGSSCVRGVFAFPRASRDPLSYGFAADFDADLALAGASRECLQRLGFLWGESIPQRPPAFSPAPEYHQEFYLQPAMHDRIRAWLEGTHLGCAEVAGQSSSGFPFQFVCLTPPQRRVPLHVARALPGMELHLGFGRGHPRVRAPVARVLEIHPIA